MSGTDFILADTNAIIHFLEGNMNVFHHLSDKVIYVSFITEIEIQSKKNQSKEDRKLVKDFLNDCIIIDINSSIKEVAVRLRRQKSIKLPDAIIAATAIFMRHPLVTSDDAFNTISDLNVLFFHP